MNQKSVNGFTHNHTANRKARSAQSKTSIQYTIVTVPTMPHLKHNVVTNFNI